MDKALAEFIAAEAARPFDWQKSNCGMTADRWMTSVLGYSPLRRYGFILDGDNDDWDGLRIAVSVNRVMRACGLPRTDDPQIGDVGLIVHANKLCIAIRAPTMWFSRDSGGLIGAPLSSCWKAWRVV